MPRLKAADATPAEGERALIHDDAAGRIGCGRCVGGRWRVEDPSGGRPTEEAGAAHRAPVPDSEDYDPADD